jgi:chromosome partition protein MukB
VSRATAEALALVNWKGVFFERYALHRHVTALEGANGAGKTTVMIAAYVVLLPDMSRLRFTNLGETGATGGDKGIWGRLGEAGRPSYAIIDFALPGNRRLVAGVHLERKGEPTIEPTPFIVLGLAADVRLQDLLLVRQGNSEVVPELPELRENAARLGGRLQSFSSARDYFAALFDHGVTPLRLGTEEERKNLNDMLRTSMTGGISKALTSELRTFLLKEEGGLADTLQRMRANLDACRRTRIEVQEARRLEHEIGGVFEAGQMMFAAALLATRERADELTRRADEAEQARAAASLSRDAARDALDRTLRELEALERRRSEIGSLLESARAWHGTVRDALAAAKHLAGCAGRLDLAETAALDADQQRNSAEADRTRARDEFRRAQSGYKLAAEGLADLQRGIEELHRRAGAYLQATRRLREADDALGGVTLQSFEERGTQARVELAQVDQARRDATTRHADAHAHRIRHAEVMSALRALVESDVDVAHAYEAALSVLQSHRDRIALASRMPTIDRDLADARSKAARQASVRERAQNLGVVVREEPAGQLVARLLGDAETELKEHEERERAARASAQQLDSAMKELVSRRRALEEREPAFRDLIARAARLADHLGSTVDSRATLDAVRRALDTQLASARNDERTANEEHEALLAQARALVAQGGPFDPELLRLRDQLGAELVAASFEDVGLDDAGRIEARLGPLTHALVVDDASAAARTLGARPDSVATVLLVARDTDLDKLASTTNVVDSAERDVAVNDGLAVRVSRIPPNPRLGRRAREARATELRAEAQTKAVEVENTRVRRGQLQRLVEDGEALLAGHVVWLAGDPTAELAQIKRETVETQAQLDQHHEAIKRHVADARQLRPRVAGLRTLLGEAMLLDPPDHTERARELDLELRAARQAKELVARHKTNADFVDRHQGDLRQLPLGDEELARLGERMQALKNQREQLQSGLDAIEFVQANVEALAWDDAPKRLAQESALVPALNEQLREAEEEQRRAEGLVKDAEERFNTALAAFQDADGERRLAKKAHTEAQTRFEQLGVPDPTEEAVLAADAEVVRLETEHKSHEKQHDDLLITKGSQERDVTDTARRLEQAEENLKERRSEADPAVKRWGELRERATRGGLVGNILVEPPRELADVRGNVNLVQKARDGRTLLLERLKKAQNATALLAELETLRAPSEGEFATAVLDLWLTVRDWLRHRLPAQVAEVDDPREALLRLRDQLAGLEERLTRQEGDLRGASEDVARGIEVQVRKARGQVNRLNKNLDGVSFGSIHGIRIRQSAVEKMEQVLRALREGAAQGLLFQADMPIEDALDEIFRRFGGEKRTGGQKLLDYREYVLLQVEIRRKAGSEWEIANPGRLSTGEAIGVGAALMMVVLTEWERDATALRGKKSHGSLRFLFLDEANRLSHDNLGVLFDLCQSLDLQLLIAAPEVARAEGNTTYRLVRKLTADGREVVEVSGRRTRAEA